MAAPKRPPKAELSDRTVHGSSLLALMSEVIALRERVAEAELLAIRRKARQEVSTQATQSRRHKIHSRPASS